MHTVTLTIIKIRKQNEKYLFFPLQILLFVWILLELDFQDLKSLKSFKNIHKILHKNNSYQQHMHVLFKYF